MVQLNTDGLLIAVYRVSREPTSTTNMTGFLIWTRGSSFLNASGVDFHKILGSSSPPPTRCGSAARPEAGAGTSGLLVVTVMVNAVLLRTGLARARGSRSGRRG